MTTGTEHREGAARCQQAGGVPLLDHLIQLAAERGAKGAAPQGASNKPAEPPEEKRVRFREGWRSARGTGSLSALHEDEVKSVAERMAPCGILKNGNGVFVSEEPKENGDVDVDGGTADKICKSVSRHAVEMIERESETSETGKATDMSSSGESAVTPASGEEGYENDDVFEAKTATPKNDGYGTNGRSEITNVEGTSQSSNTDIGDEGTQSTAQSNECKPDQHTLKDEVAVISEGEDVQSASTDEICCELIDWHEPPTKAQGSVKEDNSCEEEIKVGSGEIVTPAKESAPSDDTPGAVTKTDSEDAPTSIPSTAISASANNPSRSRLDSVPEESPPSPNQPHEDPASSAAQNTASPTSEGEETNPPTGARQKTFPSSRLRSARGAPSRRWSVSGEPASHRRDRAAISRRLVYLTLSEEEGEPAPVFEEPAGGAVEFDPRRGEWRPLTGEEGRLLVQRRRMSLIKTCSLDFDRIP